MTLSCVQAFLPSRVRAAAPAVLHAKGFGGEKKVEPVNPPSAGQVKRSEAAQKYEEAVATGAPEYEVFARPFGTEQWTRVGVIACPRSEKPENMIYGNEEALLSGLFKIQPKMKSEEGNLEYGYRSKKFPDDPVRVAVKQTGKSENPIMNWFGSLTSPVNTDNYQG